MTRINASYPVEDLCDAHLMAEHREIKRIPNVIVSGRYSLSNTPDKFTLGTGHVKFFYKKCLYLKKRYEKLFTECRARGFNVEYYGHAWDNVPESFMNDWKETSAAFSLINERIEERLSGMKNTKKTLPN